MAIYLLGSLSEPKRRPTKHIPVGIVVRDGEDVEVRTVHLNQIPEEYVPRGTIFMDVLNDLDNVFRSSKGASGYDCSFLTFYEIDCSDESGTLKERADRLFERDVLPSYKKN